MKRFSVFVLAMIVTVASLFTSMSTIISNAAEGVQPIEFTYQFLNPHDNATGVNGNTPGPMAGDVMEAIMGPEVTFEETGSSYDVRILMATSAFDMPKLDFAIFVQDAVGSNSYSEVAFALEETIQIDGQEFARYRINVSSLDLIISPRYRVGGVSGFYLMLNDTRPVVEDTPPAAQSIGFNFQFLNPYDNTTGANGTVPNEPGAGIEVMNQILEPEITIEERSGGGYYLNLLLATSVHGFAVENLGIFVEDTMGSNTYSQVTHTLEGTETIDGREFGKYQIAIASLDRIISPRYTAMGTSGFFIILDARPAIEEVVNRDILETRLTEARAITNAGVTQESFARLQQAITAAQAVYDNANATQDAVNEQVTLLANAMNALVDQPATGDRPNVPADEVQGSSDKVYELPVALWHATEDRASMVAESLNGTARLVIRDGVETMYIYTVGGPMGFIPGFQIHNQAGAYVNAQEMTRDAQGNVTSFSFPLESRSRFVPVRVLTSAGTDQGQLARLRFDFGQMTEVTSDTDLAVPSTANGGDGATGGGIDTLPSRNQIGTAAKTGDSASVAGLITLAAMSLVFIVTVTYQRRFAKNEKSI